MCFSISGRNNDISINNDNFSVFLKGMVSHFADQTVRHIQSVQKDFTNGIEMIRL